jgi:tRNA A37 threonylcarbamoyladenosine modification protein TsaB
MIDAKWDEIYFAIYDGVVNIRPPDHATPELIRSILPHEVTVFGDALERWDDKFSGLKRLEKEYWFPDATIVAQTGFERYNRGESADINSIEPIYLRKTEAEKNLERGNERPPSLGRGQPF